MLAVQELFPGILPSQLRIGYLFPIAVFIWKDSF